MTELASTHSMPEDEISLADIVVYLINNLKWILGGGVLGSVIALSVLLTNDSYVSTTYISNDAGIDIPFLKRIQQQVPLNAKADTDKFSNDPNYQQLQNEKWWIDNLKPVLPVSKQDIKEFGELKSEPGKVTGFSLTSKNSTESNAEAVMSMALNSIQNALAAIKINDLIQNYKQTIEINLASIDQRRIQNEVDLGYLKKRMAYVDSLKLKFPQIQSQLGSQILDPKESASKYLPLNTQLIALQLEINTLNEQLEKSKDEIAILETKKDVLKDMEKMAIEGQKPTQMIDQEVEKINRLIKLETQSPVLEKSYLLALRHALADIVNIQNTIKFGLSRTNTRIDKKTTPPFILPLGILAGLLTGLLLALALTSYKQIKAKLAIQ